MYKYKPEDTILMPKPKWSLRIINEFAFDKVSIVIR